MKRKVLSVLMAGLIMAAALAGCGSKKAESTEKEASVEAEVSEKEEEATGEAASEAGSTEETAEAAQTIEIVYSDDTIDLAQYKGLKAAAYVDDVDDDYVNEYVDSILLYTYGNDEEGNPLYTSETMTDDIAAEIMGGEGTAAEYKEAMKASLQEEAKKYYDEQLGTSLFTKVVDASTIKEYDQTEVDDYINYLNDYYTSYAESVGSTFDEFIKSSLGFETEEEYKDSLQKEAEYNVKTQHVIQAICEQEGYTPNDEDKAAMITKFVEMGYAESEDAVKEKLTEEEINLNTMYYKALDIVKENAVIE